MNLTAEDVHKMKVVELRAELQLRGLDTKGIKSILVDRLIAAVGAGGGLAAVAAVATEENGAINSSAVAVKDEDEDSELGSPKGAASPSKTVPPTKQIPEEKQEDVVDSIKQENPVKIETNEILNSNNTAAPTEQASDTNEVPVREVGEVQIPIQSLAETVTTKEEIEPMEETSENSVPKRKLEETEDSDVKETIPKKTKIEEKAHPKVIVEDEPEIDENAVLLDWYKSDLNLKISKETFLDAEPIVSDEFPFAYGGAKATYGFSCGKVFFELKFVKAMDIRADFGDLEFKHVLRVGWSDILAGLQLGQEKFSYCLESKGKLYKGGEVVDFGENFGEGDVIGAYLDVGNDFLEMKFTRNGNLLGEPVQIPKSEIDNKVWFPHILVRNVKFSVNFGQLEPWYPPLQGYTFVGKIGACPSRVRGPKRPEKREDCELIMLVGLACSGKTTWAKEYIQKHADKNYIILGTSTVVERSVKDPSTIVAPKGPKAYEGFMNRAGKFVEKLVDLAPSRRRNYILDQSNVLPSVQRRKCGGFEGFRRRAVVILPSDEEYQKRIKSKETELGKSVPKSTILDMKASFQLPQVGELFSEVEFPEMVKEEAEKLIPTYNKEGLEAGYGRSGSGKGSQRGGYYGRGRGGFNQRGRGGGGGFMRGGPRGGGRGGGMMMRGPPRPPMRGGGPPMRGPPPPVPFRGRGGMRGPPPGIRGHPPMNNIPRYGGGLPPPSFRGGPRGAARGHPIQRGGGGGGGGSWQRAAGSGATSNGAQRGIGGGAPRWTPPKPMNGNMRPPQVWQQQPPPQQQQSVWNTGSGFGSGGGNSFGQQQYVDPWVQHQQVPDQGFGRAWDNNNSMMQSGRGGAAGGGGGGGTWQGYGGQQFGGYARR